MAPESFAKPTAAARARPLLSAVRLSLRPRKALASASRRGMILRLANGAFSSVGRAIARQAMGHRFESCNAHHFPKCSRSQCCASNVLAGNGGCRDPASASPCPPSRRDSVRTPRRRSPADGSRHGVPGLRSPSRDPCAWDPCAGAGPWQTGPPAPLQQSAGAMTPDPGPPPCSRLRTHSQVWCIRSPSSVERTLDADPRVGAEHNCEGAFPARGASRGLRCGAEGVARGRQPDGMRRPKQPASRGLPAV